MKTVVRMLLTMVAATVALHAQQPYRAYQNYDFVPGDKIIFEDDFKSDQDGEFPAHWRLKSGQGVVNKFENDPVFALTEGNYVQVLPRMKTAAYPSDPFTAELDFYAKGGGYEKVIAFRPAGA
jgi:hypothetical protein